MNWLLVVVAVVLAFVYAFVSRKVKEKQELVVAAEAGRVGKVAVKKKVVVKVVEESVKLSDYRSMGVGASQMADGGLLLVKGFFRLVAFFFLMIGDVVKTGYAWVFNREPQKNVKVVKRSKV